jgi:hypothetical protein
MKGQEEPGIIGILLIGILAAALLYLLIEFVFSNMIPLFAPASVHVVSRDLAGLITISGISPYKITIKYSPEADILYNASIDSRIVTIYTLQNNFRPATISLGVSQFTTSKIAVDKLKTSFLNAKSFEIKKTTQFTGQNRENVYLVTSK